MRLIDADKIEYYDDEQNFEIAYKVDIDALLTLTQPNELTCEGCIHEYNEHENCNYCKRALYLGDYYCCRPPEEIGNYAYPPAHIDREAQKPCEQCKPKCRICANCSILGKCGEPQVCVDCKDYSNFYSDYNYCANCGRPMTEEAWNVIERRLQYGETH